MMSALFYRCYYAYLRGNLKEARMFFDFLREEHKKFGDREALDKHQLRHLKKVREALQTGTLPQSTWLNEEGSRAPIVPERGKTDRSQNELVRAIYKNSNDLQKIIGSSCELFRLYNVEQPCSPYGRVDMFYTDSVYAYPVEVKTGIGGHDIIGQIMKYDQATRMKLHLKFWHDVQPITICWGYSDFAINELKKRGVLTIQHRETEKGLKLSRV